MSISIMHTPRLHAAAVCLVACLGAGLDVVAFVEVLNPDGIPGSGDERFRTLSSGETKLVVGSSSARKDKLDTIIRTALVIKFP
jgi:hypothetical protein